MKNIITTIIFTLFSVAVTYNAVAEHVTVNSCNRQVTFDSIPKSAVSNDINLTEMMLVLGLAKHMVGYTGISGWNKIDSVISKDIKQLPELSSKYPNKEVLIGVNADFYFAGWNYGLKVGGEVTPLSLQPFGIKVYELTESCAHITKKNKISMDDMYNDILNLGKIFGVSDKAEALVASYQSMISEIKKSVKTKTSPLRVFVYDSGEEAPFTAGRYAMPNALIETAGGKNILDELEKSWAQISWETVIEKNPQIIVIINYGKVTAKQKQDFILNSSALKNIDAVKNKNFVVLEYVEATPGPRNISAIKKLVSAFKN